MEFIFQLTVANHVSFSAPGRCSDAITVNYRDEVSGLVLKKILQYDNNKKTFYTNLKLFARTDIPDPGMEFA